jgi:hypothetical protein
LNNGKVGEPRKLRSRIENKQQETKEQEEREQEEKGLSRRKERGKQGKFG